VEKGRPDSHMSQGSCLLPAILKFAKLKSKSDPSGHRQKPIDAWNSAGIREGAKPKKFSKCFPKK
jgi:hypothetical protein